MPVRIRTRTDPPERSDVHSFTRALIRWQRTHGRHDLPWQASREPYRVWLSEIMLQQTRVGTVLGYYDRFLRRFPTLPELAAAELEEVLQLWAGLGYYARARQAHLCAQTVVGQHGGIFPTSARELERLPGIGPSTAAAIAAFCFGERAAILDGNVKRVLARHFAIEGNPAQRETGVVLRQTALALLPDARQIGTYTQAIMDLGASICTPRQPRCDRCPLRKDCRARAKGPPA